MAHLSVLVLELRLLKQRSIGGQRLIEPVLVDFIGPASKFIQEGEGGFFIRLVHAIYLLRTKHRGRKGENCN